MADSIDCIKYYDRASGQLCRETVLGDSSIKWAYQTLSGKIFSSLMFGSSLLSRILGWYFDSSLSIRKIKQVIDDLDIDMSEVKKDLGEFESFNDFFTRELKDGSRPFDSDAMSLASPADGRILVYDKLEEDTRVLVKGANDTVSSLFGRECNDFIGGKALVVRLCPADYHRFHFPCSGTVVEQVKVSGEYHSVNPIALDAKPDVFCRNKREFTILETEKFGKIAYMEVGAFGVAGIHQTFTGTKISKMDEKGYFDFGGSTVVLVFQKDTVEFAADLLENSNAGIETLVKAGESIATTPVEIVT